MDVMVISSRLQVEHVVQVPAQGQVADVAVVVLDVAVAVDVVVDAVEGDVDRDRSSVNRVSMNCIYLLYVTFAVGL